MKTNIAEQALDQGRKPRSTAMKSGLLILGLLAVAAIAVPAVSRAASISVGISVGVAPPPIPVYTQPVCPGTGYLWTPGYWAYDPDNGYYWVPGTWVMAPAPDLLWTPGYWGWGGAAFIWHAGYWGPHVGFYGGIDYGFGYPGEGFVGGEWRGRDFYYNRAVNNFGGRHFDHAYDRQVARHFAENRVSYNGGAGGLRARPSSGELQAEHERHIGATSQQHQHEMAAHNDRSQFVNVNHGRPDVAATGRPGEFRGPGSVHATSAGGPINANQYHGGNSGHPGNYSSARGANPGGGGTHQVMTAHPSSQHPQGSESRPAGQAHGQAHPAPHNEYSRGPSGGHQPEARRPEVHQPAAHQAQGHPSGAQQRPAQEHNSRPSEGGHDEHHEEPHH